MATSYSNIRLVVPVSRNPSIHRSLPPTTPAPRGLLGQVSTPHSSSQSLKPFSPSIYPKPWSHHASLRPNSTDAFIPSLIPTPLSNDQLFRKIPEQTRSPAQWYRTPWYSIPKLRFESISTCLTCQSNKVFHSSSYAVPPCQEQLHEAGL